MDSLLMLMGLLFVGILLIGSVLVIQRRSQHAAVDERLAQITGGTGPVESSADIKARINDAVSKTTRGSSIARDLARADLKLTAGEFVLLKIIAAVGMALVCGWLATQFAGQASFPAILAGALFGAVVGSFFPNMYVRVRSKRRVKAFMAWSMSLPLNHAWQASTDAAKSR